MKTNKELFDLTGQVAIVTGGAYGLGAQISWSLAEAGANVVIAARKVDKCKAYAAKLEEEFGIKALPARLDLTKPEEIDALFELVQKEFGQVDILVNNAGVVTYDRSLWHHSLENWHLVMNTNLTGLWLMCQKAGSMMTRAGYGRIINVSSCTGLVGLSGDFLAAPSYNASKAGVMGLTRDLAVKWAKKGVTVNSLVPGWFGSDMVEEFQANEFLKASYEKINKYYIPLGRFGNEDELKTAVLFLASPGSSYYTGQNMIVDGGYMAQ